MLAESRLSLCEQRLSLERALSKVSVVSESFLSPAKHRSTSPFTSWLVPFSHYSIHSHWQRQRHRDCSKTGLCCVERALQWWWRVNTCQHPNTLRVHGTCSTVWRQYALICGTAQICDMMGIRSSLLHAKTHRPKTKANVLKWLIQWQKWSVLKSFYTYFILYIRFYPSQIVEKHHV